MTFANVRDRITDHAAISNIASLVSDRVLPMRVDQIVPAVDAPAAHERLAQSGVRGRVILDFTEISS